MLQGNRMSRSLLTANTFPFRALPTVSSLSWPSVLCWPAPCRLLSPTCNNEYNQWWFSHFITWTLFFSLSFQPEWAKFGFIRLLELNLEKEMPKTIVVFVPQGLCWWFEEEVWWICCLNIFFENINCNPVLFKCCRCACSACVKCVTHRDSCR